MLVRVAQSRDDPHRLNPTHGEFARQCYVRRGENTQVLSMREIQDLTLITSRGLAAVERRFGNFRQRFEQRARVTWQIRRIVRTAEHMPDYFQPASDPAHNS